MILKEWDQLQWSKNKLKTVGSPMGEDIKAVDYSKDVLKL